MKRVVLITGAAKGIGRGIAMKFAKMGDDIVLNYRSQLPEDLIKNIESMGVACYPIKADVSSFSETEAMIKEAVSHFGRINVLVNNAGITRDGLIMRMSEADYDDVMDANLKSVFNTTRHVSKVMLKQKSGAIINISSVVGIHGNKGQTNYSASKAGIIGITKSTAKELGKKGIIVNAVAPGFIETEMTKTLSKEVRDEYLKAIPVGRYGEIEEVADLCYYLSTNKYITGQVVSIDGGM